MYVFKDVTKLILVLKLNLYLVYKLVAHTVDRAQNLMFLEELNLCQAMISKRNKRILLGAFWPFNGFH